ncbi:MAG: MMPL family transporter [Oscillospiraceae bacterium]|jgi:predicted RND superfamily exporter protein|nr:MMPL family transporter [Oscillospiraceae bacterium]
MNRISGFLVKYGKVILALFIALAAVCGMLMTKVTVNSDMTRYLPDSSPVKTGIAVLQSEFPDASLFNIMVKDLPDGDKQDAAAALGKIAHVFSVGYDGTDSYNSGEYTLFVVNLDVSAYSDEAKAAVTEAKAQLKGYKLFINGEAAGDTVIDVMPLVSGVAAALLLIILLLVSPSWVEPLLFLFSIGLAVLLNMGTNIIFPSVSSTTNAIAGILQLCLSMDYSIMLISRYRQEKANTDDKRVAMQRALGGAFVSILSSSVTTIVGMLALVFMSFSIGADLGFVLAKGVFFSLLCNFTALPALILIFDGAIAKSAKKSLHFRMDKVASGSYKIRKAVPVVFLALFVGSFFLQGLVGTSYGMESYHKVTSVFTLDNPIVVLYGRDDETAAAALAEKWSANPSVTGVDAYGTTVGKQLTAQEIAAVFPIDEAVLAQLFMGYAAENGLPTADKIALYDFVMYLKNSVAVNPDYAQMLTPELAARLNATAAELEAGATQFIGASYSRIIIHTNLPEESEETFVFIREVRQDADALSANSYTIGNSAVAEEMSETFPREMTWITILSAVAVFIVVLLAFRSVFVPLLLVCVIQCAVFITMGVAYLQSGSVYYLPLLIVQCLLLGATVDYGILLTSNYRESRKTLPVKTALIAALNNSVHTITTSGFILVVITGVLGAALSSSDPAISQILVTIAVGGLTAVILVLFILPGILAAFDKLVTRKKDRFGE